MRLFARRISRDLVKDVFGRLVGIAVGLASACRHTLLRQYGQA
jgi:hypothetical protein